jgi:histidyl-tRNA synthetase
MFGGEPISGIGFGMGDVTMRDFLETHDLLTSNITSPDLMIIPMDAAQNLMSQKIAQEFRNVAGVSVATDISTKKIGKKIGDASDKLVDYIIVVGEDEVKNNSYTLKNLNVENSITGTVEHLIKQFADGTL